MAANINLQSIIDKQQQDLTKHLIFISMDYTKTDEQLRNIAEGLRDLDSENNAFLCLRINTENREICTQVTGSVGNVVNMIALTMQDNEKFREVILQAISRYSLLKLANSHTPEECMKCKDIDCRVRKADYKENRP